MRGHQLKGFNMKIRMNTLMSGPNGTRHPGEVCIVEADEAEMLIGGGYAEPVEAEKVADAVGETTAEDEPAEADKGRKGGRK